MRCDPNSTIILDALVGKLTTFELDNYDNYVPSSKNIEFSFKAKLSLKDHCKKSKATSSKSEEETKESLDSDLEVVEALFAKKYSKNKGTTKSPKARKNSKSKRMKRKKLRSSISWLKILIVVTMMLKPLKPYLQRDILKAKEGTKEKSL